MATEKYNGRSEAQRRADARYKDKHFDRLAIMIPKGSKAIYQEAASNLNLTWKQFVIESMNQYIRNNLPSFPLKERLDKVRKIKEEGANND